MGGSNRRKNQSMMMLSPLMGEWTVIPFSSSDVANCGLVSGSPWNSMTCFGLQASANVTNSECPASVSYTHLTLPTILLV